MPNTHKHILPHYEAALTGLGDQAYQIAQILLVQLSSLKEVFERADLNRLNQIIAETPSIEDKARYLQQDGTNVLSQFHPLGSDLRFVMAVSRTSDKLMEAVDELQGIAKGMKKELKNQTPLFPELILPLLSMAIEELRDATDSLQEKDVEKALHVRVNDKKLDKAHRKALSALIQCASENQSGLNVSLLLIIRSIERLGDIAKTIAASVVFYDDARDIRHTSLKG